METQWKVTSGRQLCLMYKRAEIARLCECTCRQHGIKSRVAGLSQPRERTGQYCLKTAFFRRLPYIRAVGSGVMHVKNAYRLKTKNGVRFYEQWRMRKPDEHFLM